MTNPNKSVHHVKLSYGPHEIIDVLGAIVDLQPKFTGIPGYD